MLNSEKGQSLIEVLVVLVLAAMMIVALITIVLLSLKNAQFATNQTKATKLAQDTIDNIRILRDNNQTATLFSGLNSSCFNQLWNASSDVSNYFYCGGINCYYNLNINGTLSRITNITPSIIKVALTDSPGFFRQITVNQKDQNANNSEITLTAEISWTDSSGEHSSKLETYLIKPNYDCI